MPRWVPPRPPCARPPLPAHADAAAQSGAAGGPSQYLFQWESSDISRLRADVQSLGFVSAVTPGGMVRLAHAVLTNALLAFKVRRGLLSVCVWGEAALLLRWGERALVL